MFFDFLQPHLKIFSVQECFREILKASEFQFYLHGDSKVWRKKFILSTDQVQWKTVEYSVFSLWTLRIFLNLKLFGTVMKIVEVW